MYHNRVGSFFIFFLRHFIASIITVGIPILVIVVVYLVLLLVAVIGNLPLGSPVFLPLSVTVVFVIGMLYTTLFLFPSVWLAEVLSRRFGWPPFSQILLSTSTLFVLVHLVFAALHLLPDYESTWWLQFTNDPLVISLVLCLPLGLYWWSAKAIELSTLGVSKLWSKLSWQKSISSQDEISS